MHEERTDDPDFDFVSLDALTAVISLNPDDLDREISEFTAHLSNTGRRLSEANRIMAIAEIQAKRVEARIRLEFKSAAELSGQKLTADDLKAAVICTDAWYAAQNELANATKARDDLRSDFRSLEGKETMLKLIGGKAIAERYKDPQTKLDAAARNYSTSPVG